MHIYVRGVLEGRPHHDAAKTIHVSQVLQQRGQAVQGELPTGGLYFGLERVLLGLCIASGHGGALVRRRLCAGGRGGLGAAGTPAARGATRGRGGQCIVAALAPFGLVCGTQVEPVRHVVGEGGELHSEHHLAACEVQWEFVVGQAGQRVRVHLVRVRRHHVAKHEPEGQRAHDLARGKHGHGVREHGGEEGVEPVGAEGPLYHDEANEEGQEVLQGFVVGKQAEYQRQRICDEEARHVFEQGVLQLHALGHWRQHRIDGGQTHDHRGLDDALKRRLVNKRADALHGADHGTSNTLHRVKLSML